MDRSFRKKLNRGYADSLQSGIEIALVPVVFGGIGWLLDRALGTSPLFTIGLVVFAFVGTFVKLWLRYDADMKAEEAAMPWNRRRTGTAGTSTTTPGSAGEAAT
jgi:F0F1-type ATP synthase assembly protein I